MNLKKNWGEHAWGKSHKNINTYIHVTQWWKRYIFLSRENSINRVHCRIVCSYFNDVVFLLSFPFPRLFLENCY